MEKTSLTGSTDRRKFLGKLTAGAAAMSFASVLTPLGQVHASPAHETNNTNINDADEWFNKIKGKHRILFDVTEPHEIFPFAWPKVFLLTNAATGTSEKDCNAVVVLRHNSIAYTMNDALWTKYKFGEYFKINDPKTSAASVRNPFWKPQPGDYKVPGIGEVPIGINQLQDSGVMFCVCDMALTVHSAVVGGMINKPADEVKKDWISGILPGIQIVPSGVWAVGRGQEHGCGYCFVG